MNLAASRAALAHSSKSTSKTEFRHFIRSSNDDFCALHSLIL